jgi:hypothetical protein
MSVAGKVIDLVKAGKLRHFFLIGGCDGAKPGRNYFTDFVTSVPGDCVILTLACGKYRFNKLEFGDIDGIPRLLDAGQCNDAYSAVRIALALADAFKTDINGLPLSLILSLVRAEGRLHPPLPPVPGSEKHEDRTHPSRLREGTRLQGPPGEVQPPARHHGGAGPEGNPRLNGPEETNKQGKGFAPFSCFYYFPRKISVRLRENEQDFTASPFPKSAGSGERHRCSLGPPVQIVVLDNCT